MNRINPLYIALLLFIMLGGLIFKLHSEKKELKEASQSYKETSTLASELRELKANYGENEKKKASLQKILNLSALKDASLKSTQKSESVTISSQSMSIDALNLFVGKVLNGSYNIEELKIQELNSTRVTLHLEIKW